MVHWQRKISTNPIVSTSTQSFTKRQTPLPTACSSTGSAPESHPNHTSAREFSRTPSVALVPFAHPSFP